jgi:putative nucleotidyltransferase with HDIG domain
MSAFHTAMRVPGRVLGWPNRHIRWKIVLPYAFLTLVLAGVGSFLATRLVTGTLEERFDNQLAEAGRVTSDAVVRTERSHLSVVRSVAFTDGIDTAVQSHDAGALNLLVGPIAVNAGIERVQVIDASGDRLTGLLRTPSGGLDYQQMTDSDNPGKWQIVQRVLSGDADASGDKFAQIIETSSGYVLYTAGPITENNAVVGVVLAGTTLSTFLDRAKAESLADVTIYDFDGNLLESTFVKPEKNEVNEAPLTADGDLVLTSARDESTLRDSRTIWGRDYDLAYGVLQLRGEGVGLYSVALPTDFIFNAGNTTRTQVAVLFGLGIAAVLAIGLYLAHRLTQPILRLVGTAVRVTGGDLSARSGIQSADEIGTLATSFDAMTAKLQRQHLSTIKALTSAIDARDPYTLGHSVRVGQLAVMVGEELDLNERMLSHLETGGYLHDIGKIGIRDAVLLKPGSLTVEERKIIQDHPTIGLNILSPVELPQEVVNIVGGHHERLDGSGYPKGLKGHEVPLVARIAAVSDMYDAMTTDRPYRLAMTPEEAMAILNKESGEILDPDVVKALKRILMAWEQRRRLEPELKGFSHGEYSRPEFAK